MQNNDRRNLDVCTLGLLKGTRAETGGQHTLAEDGGRRGEGVPNNLRQAVAQVIRAAGGAERGGSSQSPPLSH